MTTYRPFGLNAAFDRFFGDFFGHPVGNDTLYTRPALNVRTDADGYYLELAAPGLRREDFEIEVADKQLTLSAAWNRSEETDAPDYTRREFDFRAFRRTLPLPDDVEATKVSARYEAGILHLTLPRKEAAKPLPARQITIL